jgi:hypothetical protein
LFSDGMANRNDNEEQGGRGSIAKARNGTDRGGHGTDRGGQAERVEPIDNRTVERRSKQPGQGMPAQLAAGRGRKDGWFTGGRW